MVQETLYIIYKVHGAFLLQYCLFEQALEGKCPCFANAILLYGNLSIVHSFFHTIYSDHGSPPPSPPGSSNFLSHLTLPCFSNQQTNKNVNLDGSGASSAHSCNSNRCQLGGMRTLSPFYPFKFLFSTLKVMIIMGYTTRRKADLFLVFQAMAPLLLL